MGVFEKLSANNQPASSGGGVFGKLIQQQQYNEDRNQSDASDMYEVSHQWDNDPAVIKAQAMNAEDNPDLWQQDAATKARQLPIIGPVLRGLDVVANNPVVEKVAEIGRDFYVPGASSANIASFAGAAENALAKVAPKFASSTAGKIATDMVAPGVPLGAGGVIYNNPDASPSDVAIGAIEGAGMGAGLGVFGKLAGAGLGSLADKYTGTKLGDALDRFLGRTAPVETPVDNGPTLALPPGRRLGYEEAVHRAQGTQLPTNLEPIANPYTFALEEASPQTVARQNNVQDALHAISEIDNELRMLDSGYQKAINDQYQLLKTQRDNRGGVQQGSLITDEVGNVTGRVGRISNNPQWYQEFYAEHGRVPTNKDLYQLATKHVNEGYMDNGIMIPSWHDQTGYLDTKASLQQARNELAQYIKENGLGLTDAKLKENVIAAKRTGEPKSNAVQQESVPVFQRQQQEKGTITRTEKLPVIQNERGFNQTVRTSEKTPESLSSALESNPGRYKVKPNEVLMKEAQKTIDKMGEEGAYNFVMNAKKVDDRVNAVAQILARRASENGNLERAIDLVSKTAQRGTELGRAIQALSLWNRLDAEGALLVGERQLNRNIKNPAEYQKLTAEQAKPIIAATERIKQVEQTKSLAQEVLDIVSNKKPGEKLTDEELAKIKQFQDEVNNVQSKIRGFLPDRQTRLRKTVAEINKIEPANRTREQLKDYWEARAELARQKLAKQRNVGLIANTENPVLLYAEIGLAKLAKGYLNAADFAEQMIREYGDNVKGIVGQVYERSLNIFRKSQGLPTTSELNQAVSRALRDKVLDEETAANFRNWAREIAFYTDDNLKKEAVQDLQLALKALSKPMIGQKIGAVQTIHQLLSIRTTLINIAGNELFNVVEKMNKMVAVPIDWTISKLTGNERTIFFKTNNQESYWRNFLTGAEAGWKGVNPDGVLTNHEMYPSAFSGKYNPYTYLEKSLNVVLRAPDYAAYKRAYGEVLYGWANNIAKSEGLKGEALKLRIMELAKNADENIMKLADEAGKYATFQDDTALSRMFVGAKNLLNKVGVEGFGLGDIVLKYAKTPANLIMRSIDYSPAGLVRGLYMITRPLLPKSKGFDQRAAALALSRGITGTLGLTGLGYILAARGIITGSAPTDKDVRDLQKKIGQAAYQINLSALRRWIFSGFDDAAAKYQQGDTLMNYDWLVPAAMSLAMGANAQQDVAAKKKGQVDKTAFEIAVNAISGGLKTIMEQPLLTGVSNLFNIDTKQDNWAQKKVMDTISGIPSSFVPAVVGQLRNATDNTARSTYDPNQWQSMLNQVINRIPWLSSRLPIAYDTLGKPKEVVQGGQSGSIGQFLNVFVNPAKITNYDVSPDAKLVVDLLNSSGDNRVAPRDVSKTLTVNKQQIKLSNEQYEQLQQATGQNTSQMLMRIAPMLQNPNIKDDAKVKAVVDVLNKAGEKARLDLERQMGITPKRR